MRGGRASNLSGRLMRVNRNVTERVESMKALAASSEIHRHFIGEARVDPVMIGG